MPVSETKDQGHPEEGGAHMSEEQQTYFMLASNGNVKIGRSTNPQKRLQAVRVGAAGCTVALLGSLTKDQEIEFHNRFEKLRLCGEWFTPGHDLVEFMLDTLQLDDQTSDNLTDLSLGILFKELKKRYESLNRWQCGSLLVRGEPKRYVLRWREDFVDAAGTIHRIRRAETIGLVSQITSERALGMLSHRVGDFRSFEKWAKEILKSTERGA
jgi:hypothetical protein